jgi:hypothetical protein
MQAINLKPLNFSSENLLIGKNFMKKIILFSMVVLFAPFMAGAATSTSFGLPSTMPTIGGVYSITGSCNITQSGGSARLSLNQGGNSYQLTSLGLDGAGVFSGSVIIPSNSSVGQATLTAVCPDGNSFSSAIVIGPAAINSFAFSSGPMSGTNTNISGNCTNVAGNQNGPATFTVIGNSGSSQLTATGNLTNNSGFFSSSVFFPVTSVTNLATLIVSCPNGSTFSNVIVIDGVTSGATIPANLIPVGGVAAGSPPLAHGHFYVQK